MMPLWRYITAAIVVAILVALSFLGGSDLNIVGLIGFALLALSLFSTYVAGHPKIGLLFCLVTMHWMPVKGISWTFFSLGAVVGVSLLGAFVSDKKPGFFALFSSVLIISYNLALKKIAPTPVENIWFYMYATAFLGMLWTERFRWSALDIERFILAQLLFMVAFGCVERIVSDAERIGGPTVSATAYAILMAILWSMWFTTSLLRKNTSKWEMSLVTLLVIMAIFFSGTRMGIIGVGLGGFLGFLFLFVVNEKNTKGALIKFGLVALGMGLFGLLLWKLLPDSLFIKQSFSLLGQSKMDNSSMGRIAAWMTALDLIPKHLIWGIGTGNFYEYNVMFLDRFSSLALVHSIPRLPHAHNIYLMVLCEQGLVGAAFLLTLLLLCFFRLRSRFRRNRQDPVFYAILSGGFVMMALGMLDAVPLYPTTVGWGGWFLGVMASRPPEGN